MGRGVPFNFVLAGIYAEADSAINEWLGVTGGVRYDYNSKVDQSVSPRAALFLSKHEKYGAKLLYARGFRNPSAYEYAFYDNMTFEAPPPGTLHAETINSYEGVLWAKPVPGLSTRLSGFIWDATGIIEQTFIPADMLLQFQNQGRFITQGIEAEASYRTASGWYAFGGGAVERVGSADTPNGSVTYGSVVDAPQVTTTVGVSTPKLLDLVHVSSTFNVLGARQTRPDSDAAGNPIPSPESPTWYGWNITLFAPNIRGFDVTLAVRNVIGKRDQLPAPGDYDRSIPMDLVVPRIPGEGREVYLKVGYAY
jgi:outer membrane receptor protein involved in Fe transport